MSFSFLGPDPVDEQIDQVSALLAAGEPPSAIERTQVDIKEEPGRRGPGGVIMPPQSENDAAAKYLAGEMACLANTPGGGAIVVGVADDGQRIGTRLDEAWLRHRIWELTEQKLTVTVRVGELDGTRLLVLVTHEAIEPIRYRGKLSWRVDDNCVEIDATTWHAGKIQRAGVDWSAGRSGHTLADVRATAVEIARRYLGAATDSGAADLMQATDEDLVRRLNLVDGEGWLTNAGSLLLVGTPGVGIDYIRRDYPGGDSTIRVASKRPLLEQVWDVDQASQAANRIMHLPGGFAHNQVRAIPVRAVRESIVNGVVHRDWLSDQPTTAEHVGDTLVVTSPGGFIGGVTPANIITHPSVPRYRSLAEAMASLHLAEREGIGVDRMVADMLSVGRSEPEISEVEGPYVRVGLIGGEPDAEVVGFLAGLEPTWAAADLDALLLIDQLSRRGWLDVERAAPLLQRPPAEAAAAIDRLLGLRQHGDPVAAPVAGTPPDTPQAIRLSDTSRGALAGRIGPLQTPNGRGSLILDWARQRGRVSTTEGADLTGLSVVRVGTLLTAMTDDGVLAPGRENKLGRGFFYVPVFDD